MAFNEKKKSNIFWTQGHQLGTKVEYISYNLRTVLKHFKVGLINIDKF